MGTSKKRIISVDFLRGLTVAFMIFVNAPGSWEHVFPWFEHAKWNGYTPTDFIFPFFLFIVGVSISFSLQHSKQSVGNQALFFKLLKRSFLLFLIGILLNGFPFYDLSTIRIPGVLQRISLVFFFCAILYSYTTWRIQLIAAVLCLIGYWLLLTCIPVPGKGIAGLEPDNNLSAWIDQQVFGEHVWKQSKPWDPEGLLGTIPAIATGLIGVFAGTIVLQQTDKKKAVVIMLTLGSSLMLLGLFWNFTFPINKNLWTSSYVLFTGGFAFMAFAFSYWLLDRRELKWNAVLYPFLAFGSNAMAAYIISELLEAGINIIRVEEGVSVKAWIYEEMFRSWLSPVAASHVMALMMVILVLIPITVFYRKKIIIKI